MQVAIETAGEPLTVADIRASFSAYPFDRKARFEASDPTLQRIFDVGWHTARLCAHETYMDTPYWEQLQYIGDTRIQALVSMYSPATIASSETRSSSSTSRASLTASRRAAIRVIFRNSSRPSRCSGLACCTTTGGMQGIGPS